MKRLLFLGGLMGALFFPGLSWAAANTSHGEKCEAMLLDAAIPLPTVGAWTAVACVNLCSNYAAADDGAGCTEWDFLDPPGLPDLLVLEYEQENGDDCAGNVPVFTLTTGPVSNGGTVGAPASSLAPSYDIDTTAVTVGETTDRVIINTSEAPLSRFLFVAAATDTGCTDIDVRMFFYNRKDRP